ncbi:YceI family protein [Desulfonatronum thioautotrophicum]|uniref:YceI family protein n=1 Tax=Desulfonatronum thioautotrophicum TaxID=617001 RepID=UPI00069B3E05|nr:YceI family protein [Desulfonatronum thioautotrophicum]
MTQKPSVSLADVLQAQNNSETLIIDVLPPEHFANRHIPKAVNACVYEVTFLEQVFRLTTDKSAVVILYGAGQGSHDAATAAEKLERAGFSNVSVFHGGLSAWKDAGKPFDGVSPDQEEPAHPVLKLDKSRYVVIPDESNVFWTGRNYNSRHTGKLTVQSGELFGHPGDLRGTFVLAMDTIINLDLAGDDLQQVLEDHLKSDDFFFVSRFPTCTLNIQKMIPIEGAAATTPNYAVHGALTLRGVTHEIVFDANLRSLDDGKIAIIANFDMDRTKWGVIYGSARFFKFLSYHIVFDAISIDLRVVLE